MSSRQRNMCLMGQMERSSSPPPRTQQRTRRTPQTGKRIVPTTCGLRPFLAHPDTGENHVAAMRDRIDFLMKHNITFSLAPGFSLSHSLNTNTHRGKNQYKPGKKSNTRQFISIGFQSPSSVSPTAGILPCMSLHSYIYF